MKTIKLELTEEEAMLAKVSLVYAAISMDEISHELATSIKIKSLADKIQSQLTQPEPEMEKVCRWAVKIKNEYRVIYLTGCGKLHGGLPINCSHCGNKIQIV